ncbi:hypothetical protein Y032_0035g3084 [Ancylostoma ceylanicum]|uniref:Uncharacterized protein n=1 Tax=Ancylostoma ceylanicum TaxID=53326 RepID=A0A016UMB0_9BILA|nr:hypothetical protein Y032_0035g3084 [Ancylostoma ceylanicum]
MCQSESSGYAPFSLTMIHTLSMLFREEVIAQGLRICCGVKVTELQRIMGKQMGVTGGPSAPIRVIWLRPFLSRDDRLVMSR